MSAAVKMVIEINIEPITPPGDRYARLTNRMRMTAIELL
jgi:hypothetical protein